MLYYPAANLAFIHVPKNAGQSVRRALDGALPASFAALSEDLGINAADARARFESTGTPIAGLGLVKPEHLPLPLLARHLPRSFAQLSRARSFMLVRPPRDRFLSALLQHLREFKGMTAVRSDDPRVTAEARTICHWLSQRKVFSDIHYIHFARQVDYSQVDGARVVSAIFPIDRTDALAGWIEAETGLALDIPHDHARREPKAWSRTAQPAVRHLARTLLPRKVRNGLYPLWMKSPAFATASDRYGDIRFDASTEDFISEFYADDAALYDEACEALGKRPDAQPVRKRRDA